MDISRGQQISAPGPATVADHTVPARFHKIPGAAGIAPNLASSPNMPPRTSSGHTEYPHRFYNIPGAAGAAPPSATGPPQSSMSYQGQQPPRQPPTVVDGAELPDRFYRIPGSDSVDPTAQPAAPPAQSTKEPPTVVDGAVLPDRFHRIPGAAAVDPTALPVQQQQHTTEPPIVVDGVELPQRFHRIPGAVAVDPTALPAPQQPQNAEPPIVVDGVELPQRFHRIPGAAAVDPTAEPQPSQPQLNPHQPAHVGGVELPGRFYRIPGATADPNVGHPGNVDVSSTHSGQAQPQQASDPAPDALEARLRALRGRSDAPMMTPDEMAAKFNEVFGKRLVSHPTSRTQRAPAMAITSDDPDELLRQAADEVALEDAVLDARHRELDGMAQRLDGLRGRGDSGGACARTEGARHTHEDDPTVPPSFRCPITHEIMSDPVTTADGHSYERSSIERWLKTRDTSPQTGERLRHKELIPAHALRNAIEEWATIATAKRDASGDKDAAPDAQPHTVAHPPQHQAPSGPSGPGRPEVGSLSDGGAASLDSGHTFGEIVSGATEEVGRLADEEARNLLDGGISGDVNESEDTAVPTAVDQAEVSALLAATADELASGRDGGGGDLTPEVDEKSAAADQAAIEQIVRQAAEEAALGSTPATTDGAGAADPSRPLGAPTPATGADGEQVQVVRASGPPAPPSASLAFWDDPTSILPKPPPEHRVPWCCICNEDACIECEDCERDLFCKRCFAEMHKEFIDKHRTKPYVTPPDERLE